MLAFQVDDMTCGHCASAITNAVKGADEAARITVDVGRHLVTVEPGTASASVIRDAIAGAGYTPVSVQPAALPAAGASTQKGCCCSR